MKYFCDVKLFCEDIKFASHIVVVCSLKISKMDLVSSLNTKIEFLLKNKENIKKNIEDHEESRLTLLSEIDVLKKDLSLHHNDENIVKIKIFETMTNTLEGLKIFTNQDGNHSSLVRKCRYYNRGYCKFKENCHYLHSSSVCDTFLKDGIYRKTDCKERHP